MYKLCFRPNAVMRIVALSQAWFKAVLDTTAQRTAKDGRCVSDFIPNMFLSAFVNCE